MDTSLNANRYARYYVRSLLATTNVVFPETAMPLALLPMKFHERVRLARQHAGLTQVALARLVLDDQNAGNSLIERIENRDKGEGSVYTAQIAHHCRVNALWLATGEGEMWIDRRSVSDSAMLIAVAWDHLRSPLRELLSVDFLRAALDSMPHDHPSRRPIEKLMKEMHARRHLHTDLAGGRPAPQRTPVKMK
jgi:hypothetical protein